MIYQQTSRATNDAPHYLPAIPLPNHQSVTHGQIPKAQVINKIKVQDL